MSHRPMRSFLLILVLTRVTANLVRQRSRDRRRRRVVHLESTLSV
ncbi:hypothetical protein EV186_1021361 [Labedaea rhizosphaerae]|uniref:Uncharacterized protein n=1 Tax=Labedaea rhizosphaerae TaxID=598644 RepID=A0A4R6SHI8_LABRH|nr:hypothetical protein EV186_1021361 [Labedaea rhizosphaerae]